jgi:hypothetical protein
MAHLAFIPNEPGTPAGAEFGVSVLKKARGRGYGTRLFGRAVMHARNEGVELMFIHALSENTAMIKIARNAGATLERAGSETEAYLRLPPATLDTRVSELVEEQVRRPTIGSSSRPRTSSISWPRSRRSGAAPSTRGPRAAAEPSARRRPARGQSGILWVPLLRLTAVSEPHPARTAHEKQDKRTFLQKVAEFIHPGPDSTAELIETLADAEDNAIIGPESRVMLEGVIKMAELTAGDVMVAAPRMDLVNIDADYDDILHLVIDTAHSRFRCTRAIARTSSAS